MKFFERKKFENKTMVNNVLIIQKDLYINIVNILGRIRGTT